MQKLLLPAACAAELAGLAEAAYPEEACALLVGSTGAAGIAQVTRIVPAANVADEPRRHFEIDPGTQIRLRRALRQAGTSGAGTGEADEKLLGHWHSHPDGRAAPSATDAAMIYEPGLVWLISAVPAGRAGSPAGFFPQAGGAGFAPLAVQID